MFRKKTVDKAKEKSESNQKSKPDTFLTKRIFNNNYLITVKIIISELFFTAVPWEIVLYYFVVVFLAIC